MVTVGRNEITVVTGRKGCGKTSHTARAVRSLTQAGRRVVVISPVGRFVDEKGRSPLPSDAPIIRDCNPVSYEMLAGRSVLVCPEADTAAAFAIRFAWAASSVTSPVVLVVDEIDLYLGQARPDAALLRCVRYGRHRSLSLIGIAQRPANMHKDLLAQADRIVIFQSRQPSDLEYLRLYAGADPDAVRNLSRYRYLEFNQNNP